MLFQRILTLFLMFLALGCNRPDSNAYRQDPILQDYQQQLSAANAEIESLQKEFETVEKDIKTSVPQSGQAGLHTKKFYEMKDRLDILKQQVRFWKIRIETRAKEAQKEYLEAHSQKKEWPDPVKVKAYYTEKRLRQSKIKWDHRGRLEDYQKGIQSKQSEPSKSH